MGFPVDSGAIARWAAQYCGAVAPRKHYTTYRVAPGARLRMEVHPDDGSKGWTGLSDRILPGLMRDQR
jgi:hypothetical protein